MAVRNASEYARITSLARVVLEEQRRKTSMRLGRDLTLADIASASIRGISDEDLDAALAVALSEGGKS